jgi:hypothetical protein
MEWWRQRLTGFLFPEQSDDWLTILRIGLGLQVFFYTLSLEGDWNYLLGGGAGGLNGRALAEGLLSTESPFVPRLGWLVSVGERVGLSEPVVISLAWWLLLLTGVGLVIGFFSRSSAILAWFLHVCAAKSGGLVSYGVDNFMTIGLFYLMLSPLPDRISFDWRLRRPSPKAPELFGFFRRILQLHLCLIYFFGGLAKSLGSGWWDGSNLWRALIRPPFNVIAPEMLVKWKYLFPVAGVCICLLEMAYPFFIWHKRTRKIWLTCVCGMHAAIGVTMGMYLFASIMIILNLAAFGPGPFWAQPRAVSLTPPDQTT